MIIQISNRLKAALLPPTLSQHPHPYSIPTDNGLDHQLVLTPGSTYQFFMVHNSTQSSYVDKIFVSSNAETKHFRLPVTVGQTLSVDGPQRSRNIPRPSITQPINEDDQQHIFQVFHLTNSIV